MCIVDEVKGLNVFCPVILAQANTPIANMATIAPKRAYQEKRVHFANKRLCYGAQNWPNMAILEQWRH